MTNANIFDALEISLQALDHGADVESCLALFPDLVDDLRPILVAAVQAHSSAVVDVPVEVMARGKERFLQAAAEMREQSSPVAIPSKQPAGKGFFTPRFFRLAVTTAVVLAFLLTSGTGLANASNKSIPGDQLYPVKRSLEDVRLFFVFDPKGKAELETEFEIERVHEINELFFEKRNAKVDFHGVVNSWDDKGWVIGGLNIKVDGDLVVSTGITPGSIVQVIGLTDNGIIEAEQIILLSVPSETPPSVFQPTSQPEDSRTPEVTESSATNVEHEPTEVISIENEQQQGLESPTEQPEQESPKEQETQKPEENKPNEVESEQPKKEEPEKPEEKQKSEEDENEGSGGGTEPESPEN